VLFPLQLFQAFRLSVFHRAVELLLAVIGRGRYLQGTTDVGDVLALVEELPIGAQLAYNLPGCVALAFRVASPGQVWPLGKPSKALVNLFGSTSLITYFLLQDVTKGLLPTF
jgi:hypothetical protein